MNKTEYFAFADEFSIIQEPGRYLERIPLAFDSEHDAVIYHYNIYGTYDNRAAYVQFRSNKGIVKVCNFCLKV